jgi:hypothetical protein
VILPIVAIYRKHHGRPFAARIVALMLITMRRRAAAQTSGR